MPRARRTSTQNKEVEHSKVRAVIHDSSKPLCIEQAKKLLGWHIESDGQDFGDDYALKDEEGIKVRLLNNQSNRPLYRANYMTLKQEILRGRWRLNGEPVIIGKFGSILNGQHTLIAIVLAHQDWEKHPTSYPHWKSKPGIEKLVMYGISEENDTVNTLDVCKPRSLGDVVYRGGYLDAVEKKHRPKLAKLVSFATNRLQVRTGIRDADDVPIRQTHAESVSFLNRHPRLVDCVVHLFHEDDNTNKVRRFLPQLGYASALLYLMACNDSDAEVYYKQEEPREKDLDFGKWDIACQFWTELAGGSAEMKPVQYAISDMVEKGADKWEIRWAILAKAWDLYVNELPITVEDIVPEIKSRGDMHSLVEDPQVGDIDCGERGVANHRTGSDPTPEQIARAKNGVRAKKDSKKKPTKAHREGAEWANGDVAWVIPKEHEDVPTYLAVLSGDPYPGGAGDMMVVVHDVEDDQVWEVKVEDLSLVLN